MNKDKNFLNALDDWGSVLIDTYEDATAIKIEPEMDDGELIIPNAKYQQTSSTTNKLKGEVIIPRGVGYIYTSAFEYCDEITSVKFPRSLRSIGDGAFSQCTNLETAELNEGLQNISHSAFANCTKLTLSKLPSTLMFVDTYAFFGCNLKGDLILPDTMQYLGDAAFSENRNLTGKLDLNAKLLYRIPNSCFENCRFTGELVIQPHVLSIGEDAFTGCNFDVVKVPKHLNEDSINNLIDSLPNTEIIYY